MLAHMFQLLSDNVGRLPNEPLHRIAARVQIGMNVKGLGWAANGDWGR
jgi:hypothetical protein